MHAYIYVAKLPVLESAFQPGFRACLFGRGTHIYRAAGSWKHGEGIVEPGPIFILFVLTNI